MTVGASRTRRARQYGRQPRPPITLLGVRVAATSDALIELMLSCSALADVDPWIYVGTLAGTIEHPPTDPAGHVLDVVWREPRSGRFRSTTVALHPDALSRDWRGHRLHLLGRIVRLDLDGVRATGPDRPEPDHHRRQFFRVLNPSDRAVVLEVELYLQWAFRPLSRVTRPGDSRGDEPPVIAQRWWDPRLPLPVDTLRYTTTQRDHKGDTYKQAERAAGLLRMLRLEGARGAHRPTVSDEAALDELAKDGECWLDRHTDATLADLGERELAEARVTGVGAVSQFKLRHGIKQADVRRRIQERRPDLARRTDLT